MIILLTTTLVGRSAESIHARLLAEGRAVIRAVDAIITRVALAFVWTAAVAVYAVCLANRHAGVCVDPGLLVTRIAAAYPRSTAITIHASLSADRSARRQSFWQRIPTSANGKILIGFLHFMKKQKIVEFLFLSPLTFLEC